MGNVAENTLTQLPNVRVGTMVQVSSLNGEIRFFTPLVGIHGRDVIVAHLPSTGELKRTYRFMDDPLKWYQTFFKVKHHMVLRLVHKGVAYAFETSVVDVVGGNSHLLILRYPEQVFLRELRKEPRFPCSLMTQLPCGSVKIDGLVKDISQGGCQVRLESTVVSRYLKELKEARELIEFDVFFPQIDAFSRLWGHVVSVIPVEDRLRLGLVFKGEHTAVNEYLDTLHLY